jgi:hypothetical protein
MPAAVDEAADPDRVADLEAAHLFADCGDVADNLMARHAGIERARPFGADRVEVRMADAAKGDVDLDVARSGPPPLDVERLERPIGGIGAISPGRHHMLLV